MKLYIQVVPHSEAGKCKFVGETAHAVMRLADSKLKLTVKKLALSQPGHKQKTGGSQSGAKSIGKAHEKREPCSTKREVHRKGFLEILPGSMEDVANLIPAQVRASFAHEMFGSPPSFRILHEDQDD